MTLPICARSRGFTLVETLLYIGLFAIILTGVITSAYPLITGADRLSKHVTAEGEATFVLHKIEWAVSNEPVTAVTGAGTTLTITTAANTFAFSESSGAITLNGTSLTATRAEFSNFLVSAIDNPPGGIANAPHVFTVSFDVGGESYQQTYHVFY